MTTMIPDNNNNVKNANSVTTKMITDNNNDN